MANGTISRAPRPSSLADVLDLILDKGLVIDAYVRVSLVGIEILTVDARIVVASVDTYLHFAEAVNRLDLQATETGGLPELFGENGSDEDREDDSQKERQSGSTRTRSGSTRRANPAPARALGRGRSGDRDGEEGQEGQDSGSRSGALVGRLAARGRWQD